MKIPYRLPSALEVLYSTLYIFVSIYLLYLIKPTSSEGFINAIRAYLLLSRGVVLAHKVYEDLIRSPRQLFYCIFESIFLLEYSILEYFFKNIINDGKTEK